MVNQFLADLQTSIELSNAQEGRVPSKTYKPSTMNCIRNMFYQMKGIEVPPSTMPYKNVGILETGTDRHVRVQDAVANMKNNGFDCEYIDVEDYILSNNIPDIKIVGKMGVETKLHHTKLNMSFMCDGIIRYCGKYYILEIKTEGNKYFSKRMGVDEKHYNQASAYSISFGIDDVIFLYVDRDSLEMKAFLLEVTEEMKKTVIDKITSCDSYLAEDKVPPKEENYVICMYCPYKDICTKEDIKVGVGDENVFEF